MTIRAIPSCQESPTPCVATRPVSSLASRGVATLLLCLSRPFVFITLRIALLCNMLVLITLRKYRGYTPPLSQPSLELRALNPISSVLSASDEGRSRKSRLAAIPSARLAPLRPAALTNSSADAYNAFSLMTHRCKEFIPGPLSSRRDAWSLGPSHSGVLLK